jgi:hypothetical protein
VEEKKNTRTNKVYERLAAKLKIQKNGNTLMTDEKDDGKDDSIGP